MYVDFVGRGPTPHTQDSFVGDDDEEESSDERSVTQEAVAPFNSGTMQKKVSLSSSCSSLRKKILSSVKETIAVLKKKPQQRKEIG